MPIHDWTRVTAGTWHAFHLSWIGELQLALNEGLLPPDYYAQAEQVAGPFGPDVLTLQTDGVNGTNGTGGGTGGGGVTVALAPPKTRVVQSADVSEYIRRRRVLTIRHASGDGVVAVIELVSPGNKGSGYPFDQFLFKSAGLLAEGIHLLVVDLFPPTPRDPNGVHAAIWSYMVSDDTGARATPDEPLTLVAYTAQPELTAYVEPTAVGRPLIDMPLFLTTEHYINVPLEATYTAAFRGVPAKYKLILA